MDRFIIPALKALPVALALWFLLVFTIGKLTWGLAVVGLVIFAVLWILMRGKRPPPYDKPPSPDETQFWWRGGGGAG
ncbi:MAG TPA: hypothetical protein VJV39_11990 [Dongiaceae bacterium]|nr:hypothetical protein [Dongiaceae bacterium]